MDEDSSSIHPNSQAIIEAVVADDIDRLRTAVCKDGEVFSPIFLHRTVLNENGWHILHVAAINNSTTVLRFICEDCFDGMDVDVRTQDTKWTPMHFAAYNGHERICNILRIHAASIDVVDVYGDTPCDVAIASSNDALVDILGGNLASKEQAQRQEEERQHLLREARLYEEKKQEDAKQKQQERERREAIHRRKVERVRRGKEIRAALELERLAVISTWLQSREQCFREFLLDTEWLFISQLMISHEILSTELRLLPPRLTDEEKQKLEEDEAAAAKGRRKSKASRKNVKDSAATPLPEEKAAHQVPAEAKTSSSAGNETSPYAAFMPPGMLSIEEQMPVVTGVMTKEKKKELAKLRARLVKERQTKEREAQLLYEKFCQRCIEEQKEIISTEIDFRKEVEISWVVGAANINQVNVFNDKRHAGDFMFHMADDCPCLSDFCYSGECSWTCCGGRRFYDTGCEIVDDIAKPPYHPGKYEFHLDTCNCSKMLQTNDIAENFQPTNFFEGVGDHSPSEPLSRQSQNASKTTVKIKFCNPGGFCWSCCGAQQHDSDGCMMQKRFLHAENILLKIQFKIGGGSYNLAYANAEILNDGSIARHGLPAEKSGAGSHTSATPSRINILGHPVLPEQSTLLMANPTSLSILCFEVIVARSPKPASYAAERMIIGFAVADTVFEPGQFLSGKVGVGWWAHSREICGLGLSCDTPDTYGTGDVVAVVLDRVNNYLQFFKNRVSMGLVPFFSSGYSLIPAVTIVAGCEIRVDSLFNRQSLHFVDKFVEDKAETERQVRMYGSTERYQSMFRDRFELKNAREDDSEDDGRINFDV